MQLIRFASDDIDNVFARMTQEEIDNVSFGVIQIDAYGTIHVFNYAEGRMLGRKVKARLGKNFFTDVAPCTNVVGFRDRFEAGVRAGELNIVFEWHLDGDSMALVQVHMKKVPNKDRYWIFTKRL